MFYSPQNGLVARVLQYLSSPRRCLVSAYVYNRVAFAVLIACPSVFIRSRTKSIFCQRLNNPLEFATARNHFADRKWSKFGNYSISTKVLSVTVGNDLRFTNGKPSLTMSNLYDGSFRLITITLFSICSFENWIVLQTVKRSGLF